MEKKQLVKLVKELRIKKFQFDSIFEFSSSIYSSFNLDSIFRIYFSTIMGQLGITKVFFIHEKEGLIRKRGMKFLDNDIEIIKNGLKRYKKRKPIINTTDFSKDEPELFDLLTEKNIGHILDLTEKGTKEIILGIGLKFNRLKLRKEDLEFILFLSRFTLIAIENSFMVSKMIESKKMEHEINIAREIQLSLLPQQLPEFKNFDIATIYEPMNSIGGDYYDFLKSRMGRTSVLIADVEGKGLSAALLAASSQAVFHTMNEMYFFEPGKFISKANSLIYDLTRGRRFITIFWLVIDDEKKNISYVNAGHTEPVLISEKKEYFLSKGGVLTGFTEKADYEKETLSLRSGDIIVAFTDGVPEIENRKGEEFGVKRITNYIKKHRNKTASEISEGIYRQMFKFSDNRKPNDDCTLIVLKVK